MYLDQSIQVAGDWFYIHFIENPGMAFGFEFGGETGKVLLSLFRIVAVCFIAAYLRKIILQGASKGFIISVSLVLAGAVGNIIDSVFYGLIFSESIPIFPHRAEFLPSDGGYAGLLHGRVVDMLYFPLIDTNWPTWMPIVGGERFQFFRPVFNVADTAISSGLAMILINQKRFFISEKTSFDHTQSQQNGKEVGDRSTTID